MIRITRLAELDARLAENLGEDDEAAVVLVLCISERDDDNVFVRVTFSLTERCLVKVMVLLHVLPD